jgi:hypothetical protein
MSTTKPVGCRACGTFPSFLTYNGSLFSNQNNKYNVKRIENTVRVPSSEYTMNKSALNVYTPPQSQFAYVNWNQMSDRAVPGVTKSNGNLFCEPVRIRMGRKRIILRNRSSGESLTATAALMIARIE